MDRKLTGKPVWPFSSDPWDQQELKFTWYSSAYYLLFKTFRSGCVWTSKKKLKVVLIQRGCVVSVTLMLSLNFSRFSCPCYLWSHVSGCNKQLNKWTQQWSFCPGSFCLNQVLLIQHVYSSFGSKTINSSFFYWSSTGTTQLVEMEHTL